MEWIWKVAIIYGLIMNIIGYSIMWYDKRKAKKKQWRVPEKQLFFIAIIGGSVGSILGMYKFHHKTKHKKFIIGMPVIFVIQMLIFVILH